MDFAATLQRQRGYFQSGATRPLEFRRTQLRKLHDAVVAHEPALLAALHADLRKSPHEAYTTEIGLVLSELHHALRHHMYCAVKHESRVGHNMLAGTFYLITFVLALFQLVGGFYLLYPASTAWQSWAMPLLGAQQQARYIHYLIMWHFMLFAFIHVYIVIWNDIQSKEGLISSIFNGTKYHSS